jgi:uncharacterized protein (TIGR02246 family)
MSVRLFCAAALSLASVASQAIAQSPPLEQRVQKLEDEAAIRRVIEDYAVRLTSRDFDGYVALFAPDGTWRNGNILKKGRAEIRAMLVAMFPNTPPDYVNTSSYMLVSNVRIDLQGDRAKAYSRQLSILRGKTGSPTPVLSGMYEDEFIRQDGKWKILHRNDITFIPTPEQWSKMMAEGILTE